MPSGRVFPSFFFLIALVIVASADTVTLKNGDRLTGVLVSSDGKELVLKTDYAGEVKIQWPEVQGLSSDKSLYVVTSDKRTVSGKVVTQDSDLVVNTQKEGAVRLPLASIAAIRSESEQSTYEKSLHPGLLQGWSGGSNVGFALTRGNSRTKNLALAFSAARKGQHDQLSLYTNSVYATNDAPGAVPSTTANAVQGGIRYDHDLTPRVFGFVGADFQTDALQSLNLRSVPGAGLGVHLIKSEATTLHLLAGANYTRESYSSFTRNFAALSLGEELMHKLHESTAITQKLDFYPDLSDSGQYRATFNLGTVTKISKWLGWQNSFGDIYVTNPPTGKKRNDIMLTTGLNVSFSH